MKRRTFISLFGGAAASWPLAARAQQSSNRIPVVGMLWHAASAEEEDVYLSVLVKAFNDLGYVEGKNIRLDRRFPAENPERFRILARELVDEKPDVIITVGALGAVELKKITDTIPIVFVLVPDPVGFGFVKSLEDRADGIIFGAGSMMFNERARIGAAAIAHRLPALAYIAEEVPHGLLMSYGQDFPDFFRRAVAYTDRILKGAKPADLPVEQPTKFKLVLNLKTAKALGITFPQSLILSADEMIGA